MAEARVPPEACDLRGVSGVAACSCWLCMGEALLEIMQRKHDLARRHTKAPTDKRDEAPSEQIGRRGLDAQLRDEDGAGALGRLLVLARHLEDPGQLARDVEVVRAILGAGLDGRLAVLGVGPDGGDEDGGLAGEVAEFGFVEVDDLDCCGEC